MQQAPLILTVQLDESSQQFFNQKRKQYFPPERNVLEAHLTLFHHLPDEIKIMDTLATLCHEQKQMELWVTQPASIGKGVAYKIESKALINLHKTLQQQWLDVLTMQDRQGLWAHVTVQNKVTASEAKQTLQQLQKAFAPFTAHAVGLNIWKYLNGPWEKLMQLSFEG